MGRRLRSAPGLPRLRSGSKSKTSDNAHDLQITEFVQILSKVLDMARASTVNHLMTFQSQFFYYPSLHDKNPKKRHKKHLKQSLSSLLLWLTPAFFDDIYVMTDISLQPSVSITMFN